jgi:hypothetical protein
MTVPVRDRRRVAVADNDHLVIGPSGALWLNAKDHLGP